MMDMGDIEIEQKPPSKCMTFLGMMWKFFKCIFSHVTLVSLVVAYCVFGAYAFERLESEHEKDVKKSIKYVRNNITEKLWTKTKEFEILDDRFWINSTVEILREFETNLLRKMKKEGWDGSEDLNNIQWTFAGALFYSIIVITTIGYGHISPKTQNGKVVTIFYAILGIPLMLLCLSNIGDVMASSFRFLYWKICCYVCTRPPKPRRVRSNIPRGYSVRQVSGRGHGRSGTSLRRSVRTSQRSADSALGLSESMTRSTDIDYRYQQRRYDVDTHLNDPRVSYTTRSTLPSMASPRNLHLTAPSRHTYDYRVAASTSPRLGGNKSGKLNTGGGTISGATQSLDRRLFVAQNDVDKTPVLFNKYAIAEADFNGREIPRDKREFLDDYGGNRRLPTTGSDYATLPRLGQPRNNQRCHSVEPRSSNYDKNIYLDTPRPRKIPVIVPRRLRTRSHRKEAPSPRIMSPMGFAVHRQVYADDIDYDDYSTPVEDQTIKPVPIWLCVFLVVSYILAGAVLFNSWEHWNFLDSAYFCFITLTTIGFGDFVPAHRLESDVWDSPHMGIVLCSLYLLFGIALLAMSFNLVQEEVITNVKEVAKRLGIIKDKDNDDDDDDDYDDEPIEIDDNYDDGAFIFETIEGTHSRKVGNGYDVPLSRNETAILLWDLTYKVNIFSEELWKSKVNDILSGYQKKLVNAVEKGWDGTDSTDNRQWTFAGAFLYSLTVITTIGYGNSTPKTMWGKVITIGYAIAGMPLFLLYLSNIGDILARSFKWTYARCCLCRCRKRPRVPRDPRSSVREPKKNTWQMVKLQSGRLDTVSIDGEIESMSKSTGSDEDNDDESEDDDDDESGRYDPQRITVPLTLCLGIMVGYVCGGALLFSKWEDWDFLDGSYFCFVSLSTIGFGDIVPGDKIYSGQGIELSFIFCSMYLMLGMALIAMCFNLMQEEVMAKMRSFTRSVKHVLRCDR
ncbi:uncharacterized protein LOC122848588 isoform X2 [Aphidius gifuensis]|uniref:uncharacterized protein LOC122848588 isoform X2 n=1 Tax=Aphidius gifuensis TaxID=684658 RepID=UPI001CDBDDD3|nr:uncharacterized protein LOC122848588 isoform X2 [Aphidius gifuensis]